MDNALSPREIQARIRSGASVDDVVTETGMSSDRVEAFAGPVLAEREHIASAAQKATIRRRGEAGSHRRLGELIEERLRSRGIDADNLLWDAWRQNDLKWRVLAILAEDTPEEAREAEFVFDSKGRFSVADNADARWLIGEEPPGAAPEEENTVDFSDELALVRVIQPEPEPEDSPGDDVPLSELMHEANEDTSQLDRLYDMLSGISEDSVRIYTGILTPVEEPSPLERPQAEALPQPAVQPAEPEEQHVPEAPRTEPVNDAVEAPDEVTELTQEPLVEAAEEPQKPKPRKRRAKVPSWDEIMFGGPK